MVWRTTAPDRPPELGVWAVVFVFSTAWHVEGLDLTAIIDTALENAAPVSSSATGFANMRPNKTG